MLLEAAAVTAFALIWKGCGFGEEEADTRDAGTTPGRETGSTASLPDAGNVMASKDAGKPADKTDAGIVDAGVKPEPTPVDRYMPPEHPAFPEITDTGIHHFQMLEEGTATTGAFPVGLRCSAAQNRCLFGMGSKAHHFSTEGIAAQTGVSLETAADFAPEIDNDAGTFMAAVATSGGLFYGLYSALPSPGIAIRDAAGNNQGNHFFPEVDGAPLTTPNTILPHADHLWTSISNFAWDPNPENSHYNPGKVFPLSVLEDGTLIGDTPLTSTQLNPQGMALWNAGDKEYILLVNTGYADFNNVIHSDSGLDVIDPVTKKIVANVPLGRAAANNIALAPDGSAAFLSSQVLPHIYVVDLERVKTRLAAVDPGAQTPASLDDVIVAGAFNPVVINGQGSAFVSGIVYDESSGSLVLASFNDSVLVQVQAAYAVTRGVGILLGDAFGTVLNRFDCATPGANFCSLVDGTGTGVVALTGQPASGTFVPRESLGERSGR